MFVGIVTIADENNFLAHIGVQTRKVSAVRLMALNRAVRIELRRNQPVLGRCAKGEIQGRREMFLIAVDNH